MLYCVLATATHIRHTPLVSDQDEVIVVENRVLFLSIPNKFQTPPTRHKQTYLWPKMQRSGCLDKHSSTAVSTTFSVSKSINSKVDEFGFNLIKDLTISRRSSSTLAGGPLSFFFVFGTKVAVGTSEALIIFRIFS
uniref:Uncharacterized protein n=1 Tax=Romanomermis culicivorax TaxID=13658 RepID=A0A915ITU5_ROMCU